MYTKFTSQSFSDLKRRTNEVIMIISHDDEAKIIIIANLVK